MLFERNFALQSFSHIVPPHESSTCWSHAPGFPVFIILCAQLCATMRMSSE
jgi:hypothetical protein